MEAIACIEKALRLNPHPPSWYFWILGFAQYAAGQYEAAVKTLRNEATYRTESRRLLAAALAQLGRLEEARDEAKLYLAANPHFRISHWIEIHALSRHGACETGLSKTFARLAFRSD